jgi:ABC-type phosphate transport system permease subunit
MAIKGSHLASRLKLLQSENSTPRHHIPVIPMLIGTLALVNVASVVMVLMD